MAYSNKALFRGTLSGTNATLYTVPASTTSVVLNVVFTNITNSAVAGTLALNGVVIFSAVSIPAGTTVSFDFRQSIATGQAITGFASTGSALNCHVSGVEIV